MVTRSACQVPYLYNILAFFADSAMILVLLYMSDHAFKALSNGLEFCSRRISCFHAFWCFLASFAASPFPVLCHTVNKIKYGNDWRNKERKNEPSKEKGEPASLSRVTVAQWWHSENERGH